MHVGNGSAKPSCSLTTHRIEYDAEAAADYFLGTKHERRPALDEVYKLSSQILPRLVRMLHRNENVQASSRSNTTRYICGSRSRSVNGTYSLTLWIVALVGPSSMT